MRSIAEKREKNAFPAGNIRILLLVFALVFAFQLLGPFSSAASAAAR